MRGTMHNVFDANWSMPPAKKRINNSWGFFPIILQFKKYEERHRVKQSAKCKIFELLSSHEQRSSLSVIRITNSQKTMEPFEISINYLVNFGHWCFLLICSNSSFILRSVEFWTKFLKFFMEKTFLMFSFWQGFPEVHVFRCDLNPNHINW